jgi:aspartate-semialdehyde dehydrogenase
LGREVHFGGRGIACQVMKPGCFDGVDFAFFDASDAVSKEWIPQAAASGAWAIDNSATFRLESDVLLLVPEVNGHLLQKKLQTGNLQPRDRILTGPNCSTVQMVVALKPIHDRWGLKRVVVSTYQSTSGAGLAATEELRAQLSGELGHGAKVAPKAFAHQIAFNVIPHIGGFKDDGYTSEEQKIVEESRKILGLPGLRVSATAARVPTLAGHAESVNVECERPFEIEEVRAALRAQPGVILQDEPARAIYPMNATSPGDLVEAAGGRDAVYVGRVRRDPSLDNALNLWVVSDNLRKGAALNAVQIGEAVLAGLRP